MEKPKFVYVTIIKTTPEKLWHAITDAEFTGKYWYGSRVESGWKTGSPVVYRRGSEISIQGVVLKCEPPRLLAYTFEDMTGVERPSRVIFEIEPFGNISTGDAVKLTVTHDDFDAGSKVFPLISNGWPAILSNLKTILETGTPMQLIKTCGEKKPATV